MYEKWRRCHHMTKPPYLSTYDLGFDLLDLYSNQSNTSKMFSLSLCFPPEGSVNAELVAGA